MASGLHFGIELLERDTPDRCNAAQIISYSLDTTFPYCVSLQGNPQPKRLMPSLSAIGMWTTTNDNRTPGNAISSSGASILNLVTTNSNPMIKTWGVVRGDGSIAIVVIQGYSREFQHTSTCHRIRSVTIQHGWPIDRAMYAPSMSETTAVTYT